MRENFEDHYAVLGVLKSAELVVIAAAYRALAKKYHPDKWMGDQSEANFRMRKLNEAYSVLSDSEKRRQYDQDLNSTSSGGTTSGPDSGTSKSGSAKPTTPVKKPGAATDRVVLATIAVVGGSIVAWTLISQAQNAPQSARTALAPVASASAVAVQSRGSAPPPGFELVPDQGAAGSQLPASREYWVDPNSPSWLPAPRTELPGTAALPQRRAFRRGSSLIPQPKGQAQMPDRS